MPAGGRPADDGKVAPSATSSLVLGRVGTLILLSQIWRQRFKVKEFAVPN